METRYGFTGQGKSADGKKVAAKKEYVHMLNATLVATTRTICAILENYQTADGIIVPDALQVYMGGMKFIPFTRAPPVNKDNEKRNAKKNKSKSLCRMAIKMKSKQCQRRMMMGQYLFDKLY